MEHPGHCSQVDFGLARNAKSALRPCSLPAPKAHLESRTCPSRMRRSRGLKNRAPASEEAAATPFFRSWGGAGTRAFMRLRVLNNARIVYCIWPCKECESAPRPCSLPASKAHLEIPTCPNRMRRGRDLKKPGISKRRGGCYYFFHSWGGAGGAKGFILLSLQARSLHRTHHLHARLTWKVACAGAYSDCDTSDPASSQWGFYATPIS